MKKRQFRSERIEGTDPDIFKIKIEKLLSKYKNISFKTVVKDKEEKQSLVFFDESDKKTVEKNDTKFVNSGTTNKKSRIISFEKKKKNWYLNCDYFCLRNCCFLPLSETDVKDSVCPICLKDDLLINNSEVAKYPKYCQPAACHPIAFNSVEKDLLEKNHTQFINKNKNKETRILDLKEIQSNWYLSCQMFCFNKNCYLPLFKSDLQSSKCPICNDNQYLIDNSSCPRINIKDIKKTNVVVNDLNWPCIRTKQKKNEVVQKTNYSSVVMGYPVPENRFGVLPSELYSFFENPQQMFVNNQSSGNLLNRDMSCVLRYGLDTSDKGKNSFLKTILYFYKSANGLKDTYDIISLKKEIVKKIRNYEVFISVDSGKLINMFSIPNKLEDEYKKWLDFNKLTHSTSYREIFNAYISFSKYIEDTDIKLNYLLLWLVVSTPGILWKSGLNLYIFEIFDDESVKFKCPPNRNSNVYYNEPDTKYVYLTYKVINEHEIFEPCVQIVVNSKKKKNTVNTEFSKETMFENTNSVRQNCLNIHHNKHIQYLKKQGFLMNDINIDDATKILQNKGYDYKYSSKDYKINGMVVGGFLIPTESTTILQKHQDKLVNSEQYCVKLKKETLKSTLKFYESLSKMSLGNKKYIRIPCKPLKYTKDINTNKVNGIVLETGKIVSVPFSDESDIKGINPKLEFDPRPNYDCLKINKIDEYSSNYVKEYKDYWQKYYKFCFFVANALDKNNQFTQNLNDLIKRVKDIASSMNTPRKQEYIDILVNEIMYNNQVLNNLKNNNIHTDFYKYQINEGKDNSFYLYDKDVYSYFIENNIQRLSSHKYMKYDLKDNYKLIKHIDQYSSSNIGLRLSDTWNSLLQLDFRYEQTNDNSWIINTFPKNKSDEILDIINKYGNKLNLLLRDLSEKLVINVIVFSANSNELKYSYPENGDSNKSDSYLFMYKFKVGVKEYLYPIFLTKYNIKNYIIHKDSLSIDFLRFIESFDNDSEKIKPVNKATEKQFVKGVLKEVKLKIDQESNIDTKSDSIEVLQKGNLKKVLYEIKQKKSPKKVKGVLKEVKQKKENKSNNDTKSDSIEVLQKGNLKKVLYEIKQKKSPKNVKGVLKEVKLKTKTNNIFCQLNQPKTDNGRFRCKETKVESDNSDKCFSKETKDGKLKCYLKR